jgi:hypothetical protein
VAATKKATYPLQVLPGSRPGLREKGLQLSRREHPALPLLVADVADSDGRVLLQVLPEDALLEAGLERGHHAVHGPRVEAVDQPLQEVRNVASANRLDRPVGQGIRENVSVKK